jgi:hypothetical protein
LTVLPCTGATEVADDGFATPDDGFATPDDGWATPDDCPPGIG